LPRLGLPVEYQKYPEYFDSFNINETTYTKNAVLEKLLKGQKVKSILDMTCGTGSQVFYLEKNGYKVTGSDFSPALLKQARAKSIEASLDIKFIDGDVRTLKVGHFDAVITMFNAVGHLTKFGFSKAIRNISSNLKDGGIYIFDIFNLNALDDKAVSDLFYCAHKRIGNLQIHDAQYSMLNKDLGLLTSHDNYFLQKHAEKPISFLSKFTLQIYTADELEKMLSANGFEIIAQYDIYGSEFVNNKSQSILTVARKK